MGAVELLAIGGKILDKFFPDPVERAKAQTQLLELQQQGALKEAEIQMSAIVMEAQSKDAWTSRARPGFLYVMYVMILAAIPMGVVSAFDPTLAVKVADGMQAWLAAIPGELYTLFGAGYLGYAVTRSTDKKNILGVKK